MRIVITGGAGFIGSAVVRLVLAETAHEAVIFDNFTYAARAPEPHPRLKVDKGDICDADAVASCLAHEMPDAILHLAAETHVDRSIDDPSIFVRTNVLGTQVLLDQATRYWRASGKALRFHHISTDEVFGSLGADGLFTEETRYNPRSPYSASKAAADHLVRAWHHTYGLPVVLSNCSNNYGPRQYPEKLIPHLIARALGGLSLPVYGKGENVRDWLHVDDHARALLAILARGQAGESYNVGGRCERSNIAVVTRLCAILDELSPRAQGRHADAIEFVTDRPGHDLRYAIDPAKIEREIGWAPRVDFDEGLRETVRWYLANPDWCAGAAERGRQGLRA
jgi:dTDP-glucose 4,6-dehydratase